MFGIGGGANDGGGGGCMDVGWCLVFPFCLLWSLSSAAAVMFQLVLDMMLGKGACFGELCVCVCVLFEREID